MKSATAAAVVALAVPAVASAESQTWMVNGGFADQQYQLTCTLEASNGKFAGPCVSNLDPTPVKAKGSYSNTNWRMSYTFLFQGSSVDVSYMGKPQPDGTVKGTVDASSPAGSLSGTFVAQH